MSYACFCILNNISDSKIGPFWPQFLPKNHTHFNFFTEIIKDCLKDLFPMRNLCFHEYSSKKLAKTIGNSCFCIKNDLFLVWKRAIMDHTYFQFWNFLMILAENLISFLKVFNFLINHQIWLSYTCLCILRSISGSKIGPFWPQFWSGNPTHFYFFIGIIKYYLKKIFRIRNLGFHKYILKNVC